jgi:hypothetical protein
MTDSLFIDFSIGDTDYFKTSQGNRTSGYYNGCILDRKPDYILCLLPYIHCCGFEYMLITFDARGSIIDKLTIGGFTNDTDETYGILDKTNRFEIYRNLFSFENGKVTVKKYQHQIYIVSSNGKFR